MVEEIIEMQAHEIVPACVIVGKNNYDILRHCNWFPQEESSETKPVHICLHFLPCLGYL
jgi:hypothetical protein